jgi:hypothetical protein
VHFVAAIHLSDSSPFRTSDCNTLSLPTQVVNDKGRHRQHQPPSSVPNFLSRIVLRLRVQNRSWTASNFGVMDPDDVATHLVLASQALAGIIMASEHSVRRLHGCLCRAQKLGSHRVLVNVIDEVDYTSHRRNSKGSQSLPTIRTVLRVTSF